MRQGRPRHARSEPHRQAIAIVLGGDPADLDEPFDEGRAAERMLIAAGLLGLAAGISWVQPSARAVVGELLGLPPDRFVRDDDRGRTPVGGRPPSEVGAGRRATAGGRDGLRGALASGLMRLG